MMLIMRNKIWVHCLLLLFVLCSVFYACESNEGTLKGKNHSLLFFSALIAKGKINIKFTSDASSYWLRTVNHENKDKNLHRSAYKFPM